MTCTRRDLLHGSLAGLGLAAAPAAGRWGSAPPRHCILLRLTGGPSQLDTWDPKPDAPAGVRSPFRAIPTNVPGVRLTELFPRLARRADRFAVVRSVYHTGPAVHEAGWDLLAPDLPEAASVSGPGSFAGRCLHARRLVEAGAPFVTVRMFDSVFREPTWDAHGSAPFSTLRDYRDTVAPLFDRAYTELLDGLAERGLLRRTLVVATGEFGRAPWLNPSGGRDHWTRCWSLLFAGGGVQGGQVIGSSDAIGAEPRDRPVSLGEVAATIRHALGLPRDPRQARPIAELFA